MWSGAPARAGQVRVNVSSNFFSPPAVTVKPGDHVVWVWTGGSHTVTSGTPGAPNFIFDSGGAPIGLANARFSWKATTGTAYYCVPHGAAMTASITVTAAAPAVSNFRISEVYFNDPAGQDFVEIQNMGGAEGNLGQYRLSVRSGTPLTLALANVMVPAGGRVVVWVNRAGTNSQTEFFFGAEPELPRTGSAALYAPSTVNANLADVNQIIDFVEWGAPGQLNAGTAVTAALWNDLDFVAPPAESHSIEFCGTEAQRGAAFWRQVQAATPGGADCLTPTLSATWGRIKTLYR